MPAYPESLSEAQQTAGDIAADFENFHCDDCARTILQALGPNPQVQVTKLRTSDRTEIIGLRSKDLRISETGIHVGVRVGDKVYDNHHAQGIDAALWPQQFVAAFGQALIQEAVPAQAFFGKRFLRRKFDRFVAENE